jgi:hypothetical protein
MIPIFSTASRRLPLPLKECHPSIAWKRMAAAGNVYRHDYEDVAPNYVWDTVENELPLLQMVVEQELRVLKELPRFSQGDKRPINDLQGSRRPTRPTLYERLKHDLHRCNLGAIALCRTDLSGGDPWNPVEISNGRPR